jgi:transcriptional regulator with XRE-family HTH domain
MSAQRLTNRTGGKRACSDLDAHVGREIRRRRMMTDITQEDMGKVLGVTFQQIQKYENGVNRVSAGRLYVIAKVLGVDVNAFYVGLAPICEPNSD